MALLQISELNKSYGQQKVIDNVSLELHSGEIMGLIGQNGAGKTTILKSILGLVKKDSGKIIVNKEIVDGKTKKYLNDIGTIIEYPTFYESLTATQNLILFASLYDEINISKTDILKYLHFVGLDGDLDSKVSSFSLGMKQRLGLAQALVHQPSILLLDEPFNGLDPKGVKEFRELLFQLSHNGVGIIVSSHSLEELSKLVDTVAVINHGRIIFQGSKSEFLSLGAKKNIWLLKTNNNELTRTTLNKLNIKFSEGKEQFELELPVELVEDINGKLFSELLQQNVSIISFIEQRDNFEDIFLNIQTAVEVENE